MSKEVTEIIIATLRYVVPWLIGAWVVIQFRPHIVALFNRIQKIEHKNVNVQLGQVQPSPQTDVLGLADEIPAKSEGTTPEAVEPGSFKDLLKQDVVNDMLPKIRDEVAALNFPPDERDEALLRIITRASLSIQFERTLRNMYMSQLILLERLYDKGPALLQETQSYYEVGKLSAPDLYSDYSFNQWLMWLVDSGILLVGSDRVDLTLLGRRLVEHKRWGNFFSSGRG